MNKFQDYFVNLTRYSAGIKVQQAFHKMFMNVGALITIILLIKYGYCSIIFPHIIRYGPEKFSLIFLK